MDIHCKMTCYMGLLLCHYWQTLFARYKRISFRERKSYYDKREDTFQNQRIARIGILCFVILNAIDTFLKYWAK